MTAKILDSCVLIWGKFVSLQHECCETAHARQSMQHHCPRLIAVLWRVLNNNDNPIIVNHHEKDPDDACSRPLLHIIGLCPRYPGGQEPEVRYYAG